MTPFGRTGPYRRWRATNLTASAMGGGVLRYGPLEGPPVAMPGRQAFDEVGIHAAATILAALENRPVIGGQLLDLAVHEVMAAKDDLIHRYGTSGTILGQRGAAGPTRLPARGSATTSTINIGVFLPGTGKRSSTRSAARTRSATRHTTTGWCACKGGRRSRPRSPS